MPLPGVVPPDVANLNFWKRLDGSRVKEEVSPEAFADFEERIKTLGRGDGAKPIGRQDGAGKTSRASTFQLGTCEPDIRERQCGQTNESIRRFALRFNDGVVKEAHERNRLFDWETIDTEKSRQGQHLCLNAASAHERAACFQIAQPGVERTVALVGKKSFAVLSSDNAGCRASPAQCLGQYGRDPVRMAVDRHAVSVPYRRPLCEGRRRAP